VRGRRLAPKAATSASPLTAEQRLLVLDSWRRSGLPAGDVALLVGISKHTRYAWKRKFEAGGPAALVDRPRGGPAGSRPPEATRRAILMFKEANPDWGCERIAQRQGQWVACTAVGVWLAGRCAAGAGARTARATYISKGGKGLGRGAAIGGTGGVSWHGGCAPLHTI
jgi:transposase